MDRLLDEADSGPFYLHQPAVADMVVEVIRYNADILKHYHLHAFVVMPNQVRVRNDPALWATRGSPADHARRSRKGVRPTHHW